jgi:sec-independent protein translocase protein TatA
MFGFHIWDLLIVLLIALIIFGPRKLPEIGGAIGKSIREFQKATHEMEARGKTPEPESLASPPSASGSSDALQQVPDHPPLKAISTVTEDREGEKHV